MLQQVIVVLIFISALAYLLRLVIKSFQSKGECASGCGKCGALDFKKIEEQINKKVL
jgi:hypothetical protein